MKILSLFFLVFCFPLAAQTVIDPQVHQEKEPFIPGEIPPKVSPAEKVVEEAKPLPVETAEPEISKTSGNTSKDARENSFGTVMVGYQLVTSWLPSKKTISYTHNFNSKWSLEGEYAWASLDVPSYIGIDLGGIREKRYTLQARRFVGNSFHFMFGPVYSKFTASLGSDIGDQFGNDLSGEIGGENLGVTGGIGNRWQWMNGFTLGIDWLRINMPVVDTRSDDTLIKKFGNDGDQDDVKVVIRSFNRIPTFVLFGLNIGYSF